MPERDALSEADIDTVEELSSDPQQRTRLQQQFKGELAVLTGVGHVDVGHYSEYRRHQIAMQRAGAADMTSSDESGVAVDAIPDRGEEMGFGPPVLPGTYSPSSDESSDGDRAHGGPPTTHHQAGAKADHHAKLQVLRDLFHDGGNIPVGPEVLRFTLDLISSETSLSAPGEEAVQMLAAHLAEVRGLAVAEDDDDDEEEEESHDEQDERRGAPPGHRGSDSHRRREETARRHRERVDAETGAASVANSGGTNSGSAREQRRPERAFSM